MSGQTVEITVAVPGSNPVVNVPVKATPEVVSELDPKEREMLKRHKDLSFDEEKKKDEKDADDSTVEKEEKEGEEANVDKPREDPEGKVADILDKLAEGKITAEEEHEGVSKLTAKERGFYFRTKKEIAKRQDAQIGEEKARFELGVQRKENERLKKELEDKKDKDTTDDDSLFDEDTGKDKKIEPKYLTEEDLDKRDRAKADDVKQFNEKINIWNKEAEKSHTDYEEVSSLGQILVDQDKRYAARMSRAFKSPEEFHPAEELYDIGLVAKAKGITLPKKEGEKAKEDQGKDSDKEKAKRIIENSKKRGSSAAITGDETGTMRINAEDLTAEQLNSLPSAEFKKVPKHIRQKIMRELEASI